MLVKWSSNGISKNILFHFQYNKYSSTDSCWLAMGLGGQERWTESRDEAKRWRKKDTRRRRRAATEREVNRQRELGEGWRAAHDMSNWKTKGSSQKFTSLKTWTLFLLDLTTHPPTHPSNMNGCDLRNWCAKSSPTCLGHIHAYSKSAK